MQSLAWLLPAALTLGLLGLAGFIWSLRSGQFDDLEGSAWRALEDRDPSPDTASSPDKGPAPDAATPTQAPTAQAPTAQAPTADGVRRS